MYFIIVFISITLGAVGQLFLKLAAVAASAMQASTMQASEKVSGDVFGYYIRLLLTPYTYLGAFAYGLSFLTWMFLLKKYDLSFLRPLVGFGYVLTSLLAWIVLKEEISVVRWIGIALIVAGVYMVVVTVKS